MRRTALIAAALVVLALAFAADAQTSQSAKIQWKPGLATTGLKDKELMAQKAADEKSLQQFISSDPQRKQEFGDPWTQIAKAVGVQEQIYKPLFYLDNLGGFRGDLAHYARDIVRAAAEKQLPSNQRIRGYQDSQLPTLEQRLFSSAPVYKSLEQAELAESLGEMQEVLGADNTDVKKALAGKSSEERAKELIEEPSSKMWPFASNSTQEARLPWTPAPILSSY